MMRRYLIGKRLLIATLLLSTVGCGCLGGGTQTVVISIGGLADDADYTIDAVSLAGPNVISDGSSATYTVTYTVTVNTDGGSVRPLVSLFDDDAVLRFNDDLLVQTQHDAFPVATAGTRTTSVTFILRCDNGAVNGRDGGSGEGSRPAFFLPVDEAEVFAKVERRFATPSGAVDSTATDVECN